MLPTTLVQLIDSEKLVAAMREAKLSTRSLAKRVGLSSARIGQLTAGTFPGMKVGEAAAIADAVGLDIADLWHFPDGEALIRLGLVRAV